MTRARHPGLESPGDGEALALPRRHLVPPSPTDFRGVAVALASWYVEFRAGRRSVAQIEQLVNPAVRQRLLHQATLPCPAPCPAPVVNAIVQQAQPHRIECVVLVRWGERVVAITVAFGRRHRTEKWIVIELSTPEDDDRARVRARQAVARQASDDRAVALLELAT